jgi:hypothetical protein
MVPLNHDPILSFLPFLGWQAYHQTQVFSVDMQVSPKFCWRVGIAWSYDPTALQLHRDMGWQECILLCTTIGGDGVSQAVCLIQPWILIFPISASQVATIIRMSHQNLTPLTFLDARSFPPSRNCQCWMVFMLVLEAAIKLEESKRSGPESRSIMYQKIRTCSKKKNYIEKHCQRNTGTNHKSSQ